MQIVSYAEKEAGRFLRGRGWKINLLGKNSDVPKDEPQAYRIDMSAHMVLDPHLHIVDQFQVFMAGAGKIGRDAVSMITVHYADHHTGYGPLVAGPQGMSYMTLRSKTDAGLVKLSEPDIRSRLKPTKRRHRVSSVVTLSIEPVLHHLDAPVVETVFEEKPGDDGMTAQIYRLGSGMAVEAPEPGDAGGYFVLVINGSLDVDGKNLRPWSVVFVRPEDNAPLLTAGEEGGEAIIAVFPKQDEWMRGLGR